MEVKPFSDLDQTQRDQLLSFLAGWKEPLCSTAEEMDGALRRRGLEGGRHFLTAWLEDGRVAGTIGIVTAVLREKNEIFVAYLNALPTLEAEVLPRLIRGAYQVISRMPGISRSTAVRLGLEPELEGQTPLVLRLGFRPADRNLEMTCVLAATAGEIAGRSDAAGGSAAAGESAAAVVDAAETADLRFIPLDTNHTDDYLQVHNPAFLGAPHGGPMGVEELREALTTASHRDLLQVGYLGAAPASALELGLKDGVGLVTCLAIAPPFQGRGLGAVTLRHALASLRDLGAQEARLTVMESNTAALRLYGRSGFTLRRVLSVWFDGPPPIG